MLPFLFPAMPTWNACVDHLETLCANRVHRDLNHCEKYTSLPSGLLSFHWLIKRQSRNGNKMLLLPLCSGDMRFSTIGTSFLYLSHKTLFFPEVVLYSFSLCAKQRRKLIQSGSELCVFCSIAEQLFFLKSLPSFSVLSGQQWLNKAKLCRLPLALSIAQQMGWWWITRWHQGWNFKRLLVITCHWQTLVVKVSK